MKTDTEDVSLLKKKNVVKPLQRHLSILMSRNNSKKYQKIYFLRIPLKRSAANVPNAISECFRATR